MATVNLGSIKFNWKGAYAGGTAYAVDDVVSYNGSSYVCKLASTGNLPTNTTYFDVMSQAGTNGTDGTDLTTILTTEGDILYRDGSGLQRLPKGTANQVLKMNSGATAPEYGNLSSDYVKLSDTSISGNPGSVPVSDIFTSDYKTYKVFVSNYYATNNSSLMFRFTTTGATQIQSGYFQNGSDAYYRYTLGDSHNIGNSGLHNSNSFALTTKGVGQVVANAMSGEITIYNPIKSSEYRWVTAVSTVRSYNDYHYTESWGGYQNSTSSAYGGILFYPSSGNFSHADIKIYGIK